MKESFGDNSPKFNLDVIRLKPGLDVFKKMWYYIGTKREEGEKKIE